MRAPERQQQDSQHRLMAAVARVRAMLEGLLRPAEMTPPADVVEPPAELELLCAMLGLSAFERDIVLLCAGVELDSRLADLCGARPTFSMALAAFPGAHWSALSPSRPLRYWRLEIGRAHV